MIMTHCSGDEFATLVRQILVVEKRRPICDVAMAMGMEYANFHARVCGRVRFKAEEISQLIGQIPDLRLCDFLLRNTPFVAVERPAATKGSNEGAMRSAVRLSTACLAAIEQISLSLVKGQLDPIEYAQLLTHVTEANRAMSGLQAALPGLAPRRIFLGEARTAKPQITQHEVPDEQFALSD